MAADGSNHPILPLQAEAEAVVSAQREARALHTTGVSWSAMSRAAPEVEDVETVRLRLVRHAEATRAYLESPRGRVAGAVEELKALGYGPDIYPAHQVLLACGRSSSGGAMLAHLTPENIVAAIRTLIAIDHSSAREAIAALCDLGAPLLVEAPAWRPRLALKPEPGEVRRDFGGEAA